LLPDAGYGSIRADRDGVEWELVQEAGEEEKPRTRRFLWE
jgi:hypothetical protein